jgi:hypothetical protein
MTTRHRFLSFAISTLFGAAALTTLPGAAHAANGPCPWNQNITCSTWHHNPDIFNRTNSIANDWHIHFRSIEHHPLHISMTYEVGQVPFPHANTTVTGDGSSDVIINYSGAQLSVGQENHNGADIVYQSGDTLPAIVESYWTLDGSEILGSQALISVQGAGNMAMFTTTKTELFSDANGTVKLGTVYSEVPGTTVTILNRVNAPGQPPAPVFARTATMAPSATELSLTALTSELDPQFPPPVGGIQTIQPTVVAPAVPPWGFAVLATGLLGMGVVLSRRLLRRESLTGA